jgi:nucleotide-binding universal stress UspA family protein
VNAIESKSQPKSSVKILIPIGDLFSRQLITRALHLLSAFREPLVVLLHVVEVPSRTGTLDPDPYREEIDKAEKRLRDLSRWLDNQGLKAAVKVAVARNVAEGIVEETERDGYLLVFLMKRKVKKDFKRFFTRSVSEQVVRSASCLVLTAPLEQSRVE